MRQLLFAASTFLLIYPIGAREYHDPAGFRVDLPEGWRAVQSKAGHFVITSADPRKYVFLQPVPNRTADCAATLRQTLTGSGSQFAAVENLEIAPAGRGLAVARFIFQNRQARGSMLCAETSRRGGMFYGVSAPAAEYARELPRLMAVLKSFSFEGKSGRAGGASNSTSLPALRTWQEPQEMAYTISVPQGWQTVGGIRRWDVTSYTSGVQTASPDGGSLIRIGDQRFRECMVPGPGAASMPGQGGNFCQDQSGEQLGSIYVSQILAHDLGLTSARVTLAVDRADLVQRAYASLLPGLRVRYSISEVHFQGSRGGAPIAGAILAQTTLFYAAQGQNFIVGTLSFSIQSFAGPEERFDMLARLTGTIASSMRINPVWWSQTQRINQELAAKTLATLRATAEYQQQAFWDRMASSDRRREGVHDILGGTVRLSDGQGNQYQAKAGSNYYFLDQEAARTASRPDDAVRGADVWPAPLVDLSPLEVIR